MPRIRKPSQPLQQLHRLTRRQHRRRFIENQQLHVTSECLDNLAPLLRADGKRMHHRVRVERQPRVGGDLTHPRCRFGWMKQSTLAERDVFGDGHCRHQREMLMHHADAHRERLCRRRHADRRAPHAHVHTLGRKHAKRDPHERRLARTVLT